MAELSWMETGEMTEADCAAYLADMDAESRLRAARIRLPRRLRETLAADHLARGAAAAARGAVPRDITIVRAPSGKPETEGGHFSVSHGDGLVVCAWGALAVGVDLERVRPFSPAVMDRVFRPLERAFVLGAADEAIREERFWRVWTGKEAVAKCRGEGLAALRRIDTRGCFPGLRLSWLRRGERLVCVAEEEPLAEEALSYLGGDALLHMDMLEPIRRGGAELLAASGRGVLQRDLRSGFYAMSAADAAEGERLLSLLPGDCEFLVLHQEAFCAAAQARFGLTTRVDCRQAVCRSAEPLREDPAISVREAGEADILLIDLHYDKLDAAELRELMRTGELFCAEAEGAVVGFVGFHLEGCMGLLCILPPYRRRGYGAALESWLANRTLERGLVPYGQVECRNEKSLGLQRKLGMELSEGKLFFLLRGSF